MIAATELDVGVTALARRELQRRTGRLGILIGGLVVAEEVLGVLQHSGDRRGTEGTGGADDVLDLLRLGEVRG